MHARSILHHTRHDWYARTVRADSEHPLDESATMTSAVDAAAHANDEVGKLERLQQLLEDLLVSTDTNGAPTRERIMQSLTDVQVSEGRANPGLSLVGGCTTNRLAPPFSRRHHTHKLDRAPVVHTSLRACMCARTTLIIACNSPKSSVVSTTHHTTLSIISACKRHAALPSPRA